MKQQLEPGDLVRMLPTRTVTALWSALNDDASVVSMLTSSYPCLVLAATQFSLGSTHVLLLDARKHAIGWSNVAYLERVP